jgi:hypothetical protein
MAYRNTCSINVRCPLATLYKHLLHACTSMMRALSQHLLPIAYAHARVRAQDRSKKKSTKVSGSESCPSSVLSMSPYTP